LAGLSAAQIVMGVMVHPETAVVAIRSVAPQVAAHLSASLVVVTAVAGATDKDKVRSDPEITGESIFDLPMINLLKNLDKKREV